jgi:hypothetical protein
MVSAEWAKGACVWTYVGGVLAFYVFMLVVRPICWRWRARRDRLARARRGFDVLPPPAAPGVQGPVATLTARPRTPPEA